MRLHRLLPDGCVLTVKLTLKREALAELTGDELAGVVAAANDATPSCPLMIRISELLNCYTD